MATMAQIRDLLRGRQQQQQQIANRRAAQVPRVKQHVSQQIQAPRVQAKPPTQRPTVSTPQVRPAPSPPVAKVSPATPQNPTPNIVRQGSTPLKQVVSRGSGSPTSSSRGVRAKRSKKPDSRSTVRISPPKRAPGRGSGQSLRPGPVLGPGGRPIQQRIGGSTYGIDPVTGLRKPIAPPSQFIPHQPGLLSPPLVPGAPVGAPGAGLSGVPGRAAPPAGSPVIGTPGGVIGPPSGVGMMGTTGPRSLISGQPWNPGMPDPLIFGPNPVPPMAPQPLPTMPFVPASGTPTFARPRPLRAPRRL